MGARGHLRIFILFSSLALGLVYVKFSRPQHMTRSKTRACYANQKTVVGAIEMYNLDKNTKRTRLDASFYDELRAQKYLSSIPQDPGQGPDSALNYRTVHTGNGITCSRHGSIQ